MPITKRLAVAITPQTENWVPTKKPVPTISEQETT
jgi:hypothetical protein